MFLSRIGSNVLLSQYLACVDETRPRTGIVDAHCATKGRGAGDAIPRLAYVPAMLGYTMQEVLKNSCRATVETRKPTEESYERPIKILVCADDRRVIIQV